jgi:hypothetical protein
VTVTVVAAVFVVLSIFDCVVPPAVVYFETRVTTNPSRVVVGPHVTRPVVVEYAHVVLSP